MSNKVQKALEEREKRKRTSAEKVAAALESHESRMKFKANLVAADIQKTYNSEIESFKTFATNNSLDENSGKWGKAVDIGGMVSGQRERLLTVSRLKKQLEAYRGYLDESAVDGMLGNLNSVSEGYNSILTNANTRSKYNNKAEYDDAKKVSELYSMSPDEIAPYLNDKENKIAHTTIDGQNITWQDLYDNAVYESKLDELYKKYSAMPDWKEKSKFISKAKPIEELEYLSDFGDSPEDLVYIHGNDELRNRLTTIRYGEAYMGGYGIGFPKDYDYGATNGFDSFTDKEKELYTYLRQANDEEGRQILMDLISDELMERHNATDVQRKYELAKEYPVASSLFSIGYNLNSAIEFIPDSLEYIATGELDTNHNANIATALRQGVSDTVDWDVGGWDAFDFLYNTGMSMADSAVSMATLGGLGGAATLGLSAAAQGTNDAISRGMSDGQAFASGLASGIFEAAFEAWSFGSFTDMTKNLKRADFKSISKYIGKNMWNNAKEETLTEIANLAYDTFVNGDFSQYETSIRQYISRGMSEADAKRKVATELGVQVVEAAASGALMGFGFGAVGAVSARNQVKNKGKSIQEKGQVGNLVDLGMSLGEGTESYELANKVNDKASALAIGSLLGVAQDDILAANKGDIVKSLERKGYDTKKANRLADLMLDPNNDMYSSSRGFTPEGKTYSDIVGNPNSTYGQRTQPYLDILDALENGAESTSDTSAQGVTPIPYSNAHIDSVTKEFEEMGIPTDKARLLAEKKLSISTEGKSTPAEKSIVESEFEVSTEGKTINRKTDKIVNVKKIESISEDGEANLTLDDGMVVKASDLAYGNEAEAIIIENIGKIKLGKKPISTTSANFLYKTAMAEYKDNPDMTAKQALSLVKGLEDSYVYGAYNFSEAELTEVDENGRAKHYAGEIPQLRRNYAYNLGKQDSISKVEKDQKVIDDLKAKAEGKPLKKSLGKVIFESNIDENTLDDVKKANLNGIKLLAELTNYEIHVFESDENLEFTMPDGTVKSANGWYVSGTNQIWIDLKAGGFAEGTMLWTAAHEISHDIKRKSPKRWKAMADLIMETFTKNNVDVDGMLSKQRELIENRYKRNNQALPSEAELLDMAYEEVICNALSDMFTDGSIVNFLADVKAKDRNLWQKIMDSIKSLLNKWGLVIETYKDRDFDTAEAKALSQFEDVFKKLQEMYQEALVEVNETVALVSDIANIDADSNSVSPMMSERTWTASEYVTEREKTAKAISSTLGVDIETAYKYIDDINSVARLIADDRVRLDYDPNIDEGATVLKKNSEYKYSVDMSTLCAKRLLTTGTFDAIQRRLPHTVFSSEDIVALREMMLERGYEVACGICYVESTRREMGRITQDFINSYIESQKTGKPITRTNSKGKIVDLKKTKDEKLTTADKSTDKFYADKNYTPTLADLNTTDIDLVKKEHPLVYEAYLNFMNARGQAKPKLLETRAEYKGEILKHFKSYSAVKARNDAGGLRLQSFSDFEVPHLIDMMQIIMDMSRVGLKSQAYTKVPAFAEVFGNTGVKINLSLIAKGSGLDANGNLIFDDVEGINHKEAFKLRDKFSKNVGTILVGKNDAHIIAAMADPRIDYIIPFHKSSWEESLYEALGLTGYADYTDFQNEKSIDGSKISNYDPSEYWDFTKSGDENAQIYLEKCRKDGRIPKFPQFQGYPGYWKLLIDFKMYDNDGVGSPQEVVSPTFEMDAAENILNEYKGGHRNFPVAKDVVEDFVKDYGKDVMFSEREIISESGTNYGIGVYLDSDVLTGLTDSQRKDKVKDFVINKLAGRNFIAYDSNNNAIDVGIAKKNDTIKNKKGKKRQVIKELYNKYNRNTIKQEAIVLMDEIIGTAKFSNSLPSAYSHDWLDNNGKNDWEYWKVFIQEKNKTVWEATLNIATTTNGKKILYDIDPIKKVEDAIKSASTTTDSIIHQNNSKSQELFSERDSEGNELSKGQQEFFKGSKVRDSEGNLTPVYHGTPNGGFTEFQLPHYLSTLTAAQGAGYYFTDKKNAQQYMKGLNGKSVSQKALYKVYLNITNPLKISEYSTGAISDDAFRRVMARGNYEWGMSHTDVEKRLQVSKFDSDRLAEMVKVFNGDEILTVMKEELGYDGVHYTDKYGDIWVAWDKSQIKDTTNKTPTTDPDIRYSERDDAYVEYGSNAVMTKERIDYLIEDSGAGTRKDYARAWIARISPTDYLNLTTSEKVQDREAFDQFGSEWNPDVNMTNYDYLGQLKKSVRQTPYLRIDIDTGEVLGHDGRHRIRALEMNGIESVEIMIEFYDADGDLVKYQPKGERWESIKGMTLTNQFSTNQTASVYDLIPLNEDHRSEIEATYGENANPNATIKYSERDPESSNRAILANALEGVAQNDIEKNKLNEYKEKIALIETEEKRLSEIQKQLFTKGAVEPEQRKDLQFEARQIANRINTYDRQLLRLEATKPLQNVLTREKNLAAKRQKQKDNERLKQYKEKVAKTQRELLERHKESRKNAIESREKTAMRHKIQKVVGDLNNLLLKPTKERHVPEEMKIAVAEALSIVNMDTMDADTRVARYNDLIAKASDPDVIASLTESRDRILEQGNKLADKLTKLKDAYGMVRDSTDDSLRSMYDDVIFNKIESVQRTVGKTPLRNMTLGQLENVYELYKMVLTTVRDSNKAFAENLKMTRLALGSNTFAEIKENNKARDRIKHEKTEKFLWQNLKPMQAMKKIGSGTLQKLWNNILYGQEVFAVDYDEAVKFAKEMKEKYGYKKWDKEKLYSFESKSGKTMKINLEQMMSIYAYSKRAQADEHIEYGGIVLNEGVIKEKNKLGKTVEVKVNDSTAYRLDKMQVAEIVATLDKEFPGAKAFVDEMQKYLSETMGAKGNEVSMKMYGINLFKEEHYFPLKSSKEFMEAANAKLKGDVKIKNKGMTKATVEHARNPIVLENFLDVWGNHINEMAMYHGLVLPLEDFSRTLNYSFKADEKLNSDAESVRTALHDAFGENADSYLNELLKAINGGVLHDSSAQFADRMISKFKKAKVMASLSVIVQQPTAIIRAMGIIDPKYFVAQNFHHKATWEELKKYCPTAIIKETGSFDTSMGRTIVDMIKDEQGFTDKVGDVLGKAPAFMDEVGWNMIWRALKKKVATEQKLSGEALLQECGKQMTLILNETQVYDSVLARNELMRSKGAFTKMATAFMAEPTTVANMVYGAALDFKRGKRGVATKVVAATITSVVVNGLVSSLVYAMRDDDEEKTWLEKYLSSATTEVVDGLNPLTYIPFVKDAYSLFQGYKVERTDMALIGDVVDAINNFYNVLNPDAYEGMSREEIAKHIYKNSVPMLTSICDMFGLPVGNILRDAKAIIVNDNVPMSQSSSKGIGDALKEGLLSALPKVVSSIVGTDSKQGKLYDAIVSGDTAYVDRLKSGYKDDKAYETAVRKALRENDPRIKEAAEARIGGNIAEYTRIVKEIKAEGYFSQDTIVASVNAEINAINKGESTSSESSESKASSMYKMEDYFDSIVGGDQASALVVKEDIINTDVTNGKDREEAEESFNSRFASYVREQYEDGYIAEDEAQRMLVNHGDKSEEDAASKVQYWEFKKEYPDYDDLSEEAVDKYYKDVEPHGISVDVYYDYSKQKAQCKGTDNNGDGKTDSGSKKAEILQVINSLPLTYAQKDALYYLNGWSAKTINEAPWH